MAPSQSALDKSRNKIMEGNRGRKNYLGQRTGERAAARVSDADLEAAWDAQALRDSVELLHGRVVARLVLANAPPLLHAQARIHVRGVHAHPARETHADGTRMKMGKIAHWGSVDESARPRLTLSSRLPARRSVLRAAPGSFLVAMSDEKEAYEHEGEQGDEQDGEQDDEMAEMQSKLAEMEEEAKRLQEMQEKVRLAVVLSSGIAGAAATDAGPILLAPSASHATSLAAAPISCLSFSFFKILHYYYCCFY